ncbi:hypothetical protein RHRU231_30062 [Rhodococcus ruber]|uniref:Uncharacterized protein n=1 Tax=Rhodococcus ruber TaxID=1830 RepID=A0A098BFQ0_9NOCA|nr:hypothetical protein RHRU231_30062 [Rhodococcus ruber]
MFVAESLAISHQDRTRPCVARRLIPESLSLPGRTKHGTMRNDAGRALQTPDAWIAHRPNESPRGAGDHLNSKHTLSYLPRGRDRHQVLEFVSITLGYRLAGHGAGTRSWPWNMVGHMAAFVLGGRVRYRTTGDQRDSGDAPSNTPNAR